ncbi:MAG: SidA/IucD/PvdA family monooxygenase [Elainella sp. C42_A2020_010]|nr:SidA/IucD/PvdA family monooxygenase [Elainella sp. C42_A2020_010]
MVDASALPDAIELAIVGAGPHALTLVAHLLQKRQALRGRCLVFDPSGSWMRQWHHQFAAFEIPHLRSPAVHHPDPDSFALRRFAESRPAELFPPYDLPGTQLFHDFCQSVIQRWQLQDCVYPAQVLRVEPLRPRFRLELHSGETIVARRVVITGGGGKPQWPAWVSQIATPYPSDRLQHSHQIDLRKMNLRGETILIVGGGLTSGHLALGAIARGANVILMARRCLYEKLFDADPGWLGPKYLKHFWDEPTWATRFQMIQQARNGGSMTPAIMTQLRRAHHDGKLTFYEQCQVTEAAWLGDGWQITCARSLSANAQAVERYHPTIHPTIHERIHPQHIERLEHLERLERLDQIWLATGTRLDMTQDLLLSQLLEQSSIEVVNGLPVLDEHLRWQPRELAGELFIMGGLAALQVGPTARNLSGARMASERIVPAITKPTLAMTFR